MFFILWFLQVGFGIEIKTIQDPDSPFPTAVLRCLEGIQESFRAPFWMFDVSSYQFQNSVGRSIKFLRAFAEEVIKERQEALQRGDLTPPDILAHLLIKRRRNRTQTSQWKLWWMIFLLSLWQVSALHLVFWVRTLAKSQGCRSGLH